MSLILAAVFLLGLLPMSLQSLPNFCRVCSFISIRHRAIGFHSHRILVLRAAVLVVMASVQLTE